MFSKACSVNRESIYGIFAKTLIMPNQLQANNGTGFLIAPDICVTASHILHHQNDKSKPIHSNIEAIRTPDIGNKMIKANLIAEDKDNDLALLKLSTDGTYKPLSLHKNKVKLGTNCGSLGFPLANINVANKQLSFNLTERFQGSYISSFNKRKINNSMIYIYESDSLMYGGSSGCPGFTKDGKVFGLHFATVTEGKGKDIKHTNRLAISLWVTSMDIISFAKSNGISI